MQRIYLPEVNSGESLTLSKEQSRYLLQVHRMNIGDTLAVFDGKSKEYLARILLANKSSAVIEIVDIIREELQPETRFILAQALPKQGKMETVIQKACELGVSEIVPFKSRYSQVRLNEKQQQKKLERWNKVAEEACRQCRRISVPDIKPLIDFKDLLKNDGEIWLAYEGENCMPIGDAVSNCKQKCVTMVIGSEGGFSKEEISLAKEMEAKIVSLGPRVLRTETAGLAILSILQYTLGDLSGKETPFIYKG